MKRRRDERQRRPHDERPHHKPTPSPAIVAAGDDDETSDAVSADEDAPDDDEEDKGRGQTRTITRSKPTAPGKRGWQAAAPARPRKRGCYQQALPDGNEYDEWSSLGYGSPRQCADHTKPEGVC